MEKSFYVTLVENQMKLVNVGVKYDEKIITEKM